MATRIEPPSGLKCLSNIERKIVCEFYGSPLWNGYCSKCYKLHIVGTGESQIKADFKSGSFPLKNPPDLIKDVGERIIHQPANKIKDFAQNQAEQLKLRLRSLKFGNQGTKLYKECDQLIEQCHKSQFAFEHLQKSVQLFYRNLDSLLASSQAEDEDQREVIQSFEDYLATRLHAYFFSKFPQLEEADKVLQKRITNLYWVTAEQLECPLTGQVIAKDAEGVGNHLDNAMASLMLIHSKKTPKEKLHCIDESCEELNIALQKALSRPVSADDFLPSFVWMMLTSKPPQLESNAAFIDCMAHPLSVTQGQSAYNFNTLQVALHYISKEINSVSLKVPEEDFEKLMRGEVTRKIMFTDMIKNLEVKQAQLDVLNTRHEQLLEDVKSLTRSISSFRESLKLTCDQVLSAADKQSAFSSCPGGLNEQQQNQRLTTLNDLISDFDYSAKPSIDDLLSNHSGSVSSLGQPLMPTMAPSTSFQSQSDLSSHPDLFALNANKNLDSDQPVSLPPMPSSRES